MGKIFDIINVPMGYVLRFGNMIGGNYLVALLVFAIAVEIILLPFGIKQQKNSIKQAKLRPKEMAIRKKYAGRNDQVTQRKIQEEIQELYRSENFNPASGCLPLLIQFPILIALYQVVMNPLRYVCGIASEVTTKVAEVIKSDAVREFLGKIGSFNIDRVGSQDIHMIEPIKALLNTAQNPEGIGVAELEEAGYDIATELPNFNVLGINLGEIPSIAWNLLILVPILTFVCSLISSKVIKKFSYQPTMGDGQQNKVSMKIMEYTMPLMSVWICFMVPAAIGVYWMFKQLLGMIKQIILAKLMPVPTFTEEDYKAAEREYAGKKPKKGEKELDPNRPRPRSLHHIDDDDFEDTRKSPPAPDPKPEEETPPAGPEISAPSTVETAPLKDESDRPKK